MSTQQDIYAAGFEKPPAMLNKDNYVSWSSRLLRYAKSKPNGKLIYNSIINGPYVRRMILKPGDPDREVLVAETFHEQTDDELTEKEVKKMEADDQDIQIILMGLPEDIYAAVDSCETAQKIWLRVQQMMKGYDIGIQEKKAKLFNEWERFTSTDGESIESYYHRFLKLMNDFKRNKHFPEKIASNLKFLNNLQPEWRRHVTIVHQKKDLHEVDYTQLYDFLKYNQAEVNELRAERLARAHDPLALMANSNNPYNYPMQMVGGNGRNQFRQYVGNNIGNQNGIANPNANQNGNGNVVAARAEGNGNGNNGNQIRRRDVAYLQTQLLIAQKEDAGIQLQAEEFDLMATAGDLDKIEEVNANCILMANSHQASTSSTQTDKAPIYDSDGSAEVHHYDNCYNNDIFNMFTQEEHVEQSRRTVEQHPATVEETPNESLAKHKALEFEIDRLLRAIVSQDIMSIVQSNSVVDTSNLQTELDRTKEKLENCIIKKEKEYAVLWNNCKDTPCESDTLDSLLQKLENENVELEFQVSEQKNITKGTSANTKFVNQSTSGTKLYSVTPFPNSKVIPKVVETNDLSKPVTSNSVPTTTESKVVTNDKVITPRMFRINSFKTSREDKFVPINKVRASVRTNLITVSQPHVIIKKHVNFNLNGLSYIGVDNTAKTRRPQAGSNTKNDRVLSASKSSCIKNKEVKVEEHHTNLLLSKNKKHMSSECNNIKLAIRNDKSEVICAMCTQCLITSIHDVCVLNYVNGMNSHVNNLYDNVSKTANQKKHKPTVTKPKKVWSKERLALPKPRKPRTCLRWSPTGRMFDFKGKIIKSSESESQSDCSKGNLKLLINFVWKFLGTVRFGNDHIAAILDLEVAFRRNTCFVRNLEGVDLLKGNCTTNLYTINHHEMASASSICLMAYATSTKSWLWHQRLSHLNFDTINDLAKNNLVTGLLKFKYHKEHLCPSCEQGKSKMASHPPKLVPNSKQMSHLLHMDLCGPMRFESINGKRVPDRVEFRGADTPYLLCWIQRIESEISNLQISSFKLQKINDGINVMLFDVIIDDYSRYTWVHFLRSKDEAQEEIKIFLKKIIVLLQAPVIIVRTDKGTKFKNQVLQEYFDCVGISHQASSVKTPQQNGVVKRRNWASVEAARTMLIFSRAPLFLWAEAIATTCYTQNCSIIYRRFNKTPYELINGKKSDISFLHSLQLKDKEDYRDLDLTYAPSTITTQKPTERELDLLFKIMYDDYIGGQPSAALRTIPAAIATKVLQILTTSTTIEDTAPTPINSSSQATNIPNTSQDVDELEPQQQHVQ
ncbi:retrovirus-related pol polyprotein from transposon TNT 1-94 [Tanacetum coccineum]